MREHFGPRGSKRARSSQHGGSRGCRSLCGNRLGGSVLAAAFALACVDTEPPEADALEAPLKATVEVKSESIIVHVPPNAFGIHTSVYDNALHDPQVDAELEVAGIEMLRYPGGGYSDNYHWATHSMTPWPGGDDGYLAARSDFGNYLDVVFATDSSLMITVNYGSNQAGDGPGEPKEAAAWVAYANGDPEDDTLIGEDSTGEDWRTVGYWASLRAADKLEQDDGYNFLRVSRPEPVGIEYWEIGNEVFGNGYYASGSDLGFELDLHVPYDGTSRRGHPDLSGQSYGAGVALFAREMKAVDPDIKIGAVLVTPPGDYAWGPTWNDEVLAECGRDIEFGVVHWYPNSDDLLNAPQLTIPTMFNELNSSFEEHGGDDFERIEVTVTELGTAPGAPEQQVELGGLFAGESYLRFIEQGATNVAWLELHTPRRVTPAMEIIYGSFLSEGHSRRGRAFQGIRLAHMVADVGDALVQTTSSVARTDLVAHAGVRQDGHQTVMLLNAHRFRDAQVTVTGLAGSGDAEVYRYDPFGEEKGTSDQVEGPESIQIDEGEAVLDLPCRTMAVVINER